MFQNSFLFMAKVAIVTLITAIAVVNLSVNAYSATCTRCEGNGKGILWGKCSLCSGSGYITDQQAKDAEERWETVQTVGATVGAVAVAAAALAAYYYGQNQNDSAPYTKDDYKRHRFNQTEKDEIWKNNINSNSQRVHDPTGKFMSKDKPWVAGHNPGKEYHKSVDEAVRNQTPPDDFNHNQKILDNYRPELPGTNRSHKYEEKYIPQRP